MNCCVLFCQFVQATPGSLTREWSPSQAQFLSEQNLGGLDLSSHVLGSHSNWITLNGFVASFEHGAHFCVLHRFMYQVLSSQLGWKLLFVHCSVSPPCQQEHLILSSVCNIEVAERRLPLTLATDPVSQKNWV